MMRLIDLPASLRRANDRSDSGCSLSRVFGSGLAALAVALLLGAAAPSASAQTFAERILSLDVSDIGVEKDLVRDAAVRVNNNDTAGAIDLLKMAREKNPAIAPAHVLLARILAAVGRGAQMRAPLEQVVKDDPSDPEPYLLFAQIAYRAGRFTDAELLFEKTTALAKPFTVSAKRKRRFLIQGYNGLAQIAERRTNWPAAEKHLREMITVDPDTGLSHQRLGIALFRQDKTTDAYKSLKDARAADASLPAAEVVMSKLYSQKNDDKSAQEWIKKALKENPNDTSTRLAVVQRLLETGQADQAKTHADAAYEADKTSVNAKVLRGIASRMTKNYENAEAWLVAAHRQAPTNFAATNHLVHVLLAQADKTKRELALQYAIVNARVYPFQANRPTAQGIESTVTLGWVYYRMNRNREAQQLLANVINRLGNSPDGSYFVSRILVDSGKKEQAVQFLESALKTKQLFVEREAAEKLLAKIKGG